MRSMFSAITSLMPADISAYGDCSRLEPLPRRLPLTAPTKPPRLTSPRLIGVSLPHFRPVYGNSPSVSSKKKQICAGVISSVEISSRSLGLRSGCCVSHGRSSPASCRLMSSGSSVRNRMRPCSRTRSGRLATVRCNNDVFTARFYRRTSTANDRHCWYAAISSILAQHSNHAALDLYRNRRDHDWSHSNIRRLQPDLVAFPEHALQGGVGAVDQRHYDLAIARGIGFLHQHVVAVDDV